MNMSQEMANECRTDAFRRNPQLEVLIEKLNFMLQSGAESEMSQFSAPRLPLILIVGGPRSGTTLMMQWLAASGCFGYPSNLIARFYKAPYIGALIHEMLINPKYRYKKDFEDIQPYTMLSSFNSDLGKTEGLAAPNVFWYFWRRFFDFDDCPYLDERKRQSADTLNFIKEVAAIESVFEKPFSMKAIIVNWNLEFINQLFRHILFIHVRRDPAYQMTSILKARERFRGDSRLWWGFKPPEYDAMNFDGPEEEVAAQVFYTRRAIENAFARIANERSLSVDYEEFCNKPKMIYDMIGEKLDSQGYALPDNDMGQAGFINSNGPVTAEIKRLKTIYSGMS